MIRYRIRSKRNRYSILAEGKYRLRYLKGRVVTTPEGTLGIFCFKTRKDAERFASRSSPSSKHWTIYKVRGCGRQKIPKEIGFRFSEQLLDAFYSGDIERSMHLNDKSIVLYDQVEVLE